MKKTKLEVCWTKYLWKILKKCCFNYNDDIKGTGSGSVILRDIGAIITNWHVIQDAEVVGIIFKKDGEIEKSVDGCWCCRLWRYKRFSSVELNGKVPNDVNELKFLINYLKLVLMFML